MGFLPNLRVGGITPAYWNAHIPNVFKEQPPPYSIGVSCIIDVSMP